MCRECFARYLKLIRRALSDASAIAAAAAAGITPGGQLLAGQELVEAAAAEHAGQGGGADVVDTISAGGSRLQKVQHRALALAMLLVKLRRCGPGFDLVVAPWSAGVLAGMKSVS
jgi:hypothetical protein